MNNKVIDIYTLPIFKPTNLVVCKNISIEELRKKYVYMSEDRELEDNSEYPAVVYRVYDKKTELATNLVVLNTKLIKSEQTVDKLANIEIVSHEAYHVAYNILEYCNIPLNEYTDEVVAYLVGWISKCIYKTWKK